MVEIMKTSNFSKMCVTTCVAKQHAYECGQSLFTIYKVPLEVNLIQFWMVNKEYPSSMNDVWWWMWKHNARCTSHCGPLLGFCKTCWVGVQGFVFQLEDTLVLGLGNIFKYKTRWF